MNHTSFIAGIKQSLPEDSWSWAVPALRQDDIVWRYLNSGCGLPALERAADYESDYSPAALALMALENPISLSLLRSSPIQTGLPEIEDTQTALEKPATPTDAGHAKPECSQKLAQVGLQALQLRETRCVKGTWEDLPRQITSLSATTLACLYGMLPDPVEMLLVLIFSGAKNGIELALHALLSNPLPRDEHTRVLLQLASELSQEKRLSLLRTLALPRPDLAASLAKTLLSIETESPTLAAADGDYTDRIDQLAQMLQSAEYFTRAGQMPQAAQAWESSGAAAQSLQAYLAAQLAHSSTQEHDTQTALAAWERAVQLDPTTPDYVANYALALLAEGRSADAQARLSEPAYTAAHPWTLLANARLASTRGNLESAEADALRALEILDYMANLGSLRPSHRGRLEAELGSLLLELGLPEQSGRAIERALEALPNDPDLLMLAAQAHLAARQPEQAVSDAHLASALGPGRLDLRLLLARCLEQAGMWREALQERSILVERVEQPGREDLRDQAACALQAGDPGLALSICQGLLTQEETDGLTCTLLGEASTRLGNKRQAFEYLMRAIQYAPEHPAGWLSLARLYNQEGMLQKAMDTLQAGCRAAPDLPEIQLALGEALLINGAPSQALATLRRAAMQVVKPGQTNLESFAWHPLRALNMAEAPRELADRVALRLGQTLYQLGHYDEAAQILESGYQRAPADAEIARAYARTLLAGGQSNEAIAPLKSLLDTHPADVEPYLNYTRCILAAQPCDPTSDQLAAGLASIRRGLEIEPDNGEASALLAETLAAAHEWVAALDAYQIALDSKLSQEPAWLARLSLGLGKVALELGQVETAVAALQEASSAEARAAVSSDVVSSATVHRAAEYSGAAPTQADIQRHLSVAYDAAGLSAEALQAARTARELAPNTIPILVWFAAQILDLKDRFGTETVKIQAEAISALEHAAHIAPEQANLWVQLGQSCLRIGQREAAQRAFEQLARLNAASSQATTNDLVQAAQGLLQIGAPAAATECLERALEKSHIQTTSSFPGVLAILSLLVRAQAQQGNLEQALRAVNQAIKIDAQQPEHYITKAGLLLKAGGKVQDIHNCIQTALKLNPQDPGLHRQAAQIFQAGGDLSLALEQAEWMMRVSLNSPGSHLAARTLAADLAAAMLQDQRARTYLEYQPPAASDLPMAELLTLQAYHCQRAELALEDVQDHSGWNELPDTTGSIPDEPRSLALRACLAYRQNDVQNANEMLQRSLAATQNLTEAALPTWRAQAQAALEMHQWGSAFKLLQQICTSAPGEPRSHLLMARALVIQAEFQQMCQTLEIIQRAPGTQTLTTQALQEFETALQNTEHWLKITPSQVTDNTHPAILRWRARGQAAFHSDQEGALALASLAPNPQDSAARIACLHKLGETSAASLAAREFSQHPLVLLQLAMALAKEKPRQAMAAIHVAADTLIQTEGRPTLRQAALPYDILPEVHYLTARLFHDNGNRASDQQSAIQAIRTALALWPDEPRWHILAAEICLKPGQTGESDPAVSGDTALLSGLCLDDAIEHYQKAIQLEADNPIPHLSLGEIYLKAALPSEAVRFFEQAGIIAPDDLRAWLYMARAYRATRDLETAAARAERAVSLAPSQVEPLLMRGEIALEANNPRGALSRAQAALRIEPDNPAALLLMARTLNGLERTDEALEMLERALPLASQPLPISLERVRILRRAKGAEAALEAALQLAGRYPEESSVQALLAELMENAGQNEKAIRAAQRALRHGENQPGLDDREQTNLHHLLGRLLHRSGQLDQAVYHLTEAIRISPGMVETYLELGQTHQEQRQHNQALAVYQQAMNVAPQDFRSYYMVGVALKESKDYPGAEKMLRRAAELAPGDPAIHRLLAAVVALNLVHNQRDPLRDIRMNRVA